MHEGSEPTPPLVADPAVRPPQVPPDFPAGAALESTAGLARAEDRRRRRFAALIVAGATGALLSTAWSLKPSNRGFGTHEALGLPPCSWPAQFGIPCPSCGMTTAFAYAAKGDLVASFMTQPLGCLLAVATGMAFVASVWTLVSGKTVLPVYERLWNARSAWLVGLAALLAWGYKAAVMRGWME